METNIFSVFLLIAIILVGSYLLIDSCIAILVRKKKCTEELEGTVHIDRCIEVEQEGGLTSYEFQVGLRYYYKDSYYVYKFESRSHRKDEFEEGSIHKVYVQPNEPMYLMNEKHKINDKTCIIKGIIGGIILAPFLMIGGAMLLMVILELLLIVLELIQKIIV